METLRTSTENIDPAFNESERAAVIACAAELQRQDGLRTKLSDLEQAASEAGIEPRFVREAVRLQSPKVAPPQSTKADDRPMWRVATLAIVFMPAEVLVISWAQDFVISLWGSCVVAALFGLALISRKCAPWLAVAWPMFIVLSIVVFDKESRATSRWGIEMLLGAIQCVVAVGVHMLAPVLRSSAPGASSLSNRGVVAGK